MVLLLLMPTVFKIRSASIMTAEPDALSVAPVPECHESKCAPIITISSFNIGSVPGISAITLYPCKSLL